MERLQDRIEGLEGEELVSTLLTILEEMCSRIEDLEAHEAVPDSTLMLVALDGRLQHLEAQIGRVAGLLARLAP